MGDTATVHLVNTQEQAVWGRLWLRAVAYEETRPLTLWLDDQALGTFAIAPDSSTLRLELVLPPGEHTLRLESPSGTEQAAPYRRLSLAFSSINLLVEPDESAPPPR
jgi:hypothetical protein